MIAKRTEAAGLIVDVLGTQPNLLWLLHIYHIALPFTFSRRRKNVLCNALLTNVCPSSLDEYEQFGRKNELAELLKKLRY